MGDLGKMLKGIGRGIAALGGGALLAYEYYSFSPNPDAVIATAVVMGFVAALVIFFLLSKLGKSGD